MKRFSILAVGMLMASVANATPIQTFNAVVSGTLTGSVFSGSGTLTGTGTATLDSDFGGYLQLDTTTLSLAVTVLPPPNDLLNETQTATNFLYGTLTGLVLDPYSVDTMINTCVDNNAATLCSIINYSPFFVTNPGGAAITFDISPGGTTIFTGTQDLSALYGFGAGSGTIVLSSTTTLTAVPEPGTAALFLAGLAGLAALGRSRQRV